MGASVNKITHEQVVRIWTLSSNFKQLFQVIKLSVNVSTNLKYKIFISQEVQTTIIKISSSTKNTFDGSECIDLP